MCQTKNYWSISKLNKITLFERYIHYYRISTYNMTKGVGSYIGNNNLGMNEKGNEK